MGAAASQAAHNHEQRRYYETFERPRIKPRRTASVLRQITMLCDAASISPEQRILEIGAGEGRATEHLVLRGCSVVATDLSPVLLGRLSDRLGARVACLAADVVELPRLLSQRFDRVVGFMVLHHLYDLEAAFAAVKELLSPGGVAAFLEPNGWNPLFYAQIIASPDMTWRGDGGVVAMRPRRLHAAMRAAGLVPEPVRRFGLLPPLVSDYAAGAALERRLEPWLLWWPPAAAYQVVLARCPR